MILHDLECPCNWDKPERKPDLYHLGTFDSLRSVLQDDAQKANCQHYKVLEQEPGGWVAWREVDPTYCGVLSPEGRDPGLEGHKTPQPVDFYHNARTDRPDDEITVLGYFPNRDFTLWPVFHDSEIGGWRDAATGQIVRPAPTHWTHLHEVPPPYQLTTHATQTKLRSKPGRSQ